MDRKKLLFSFSLAAVGIAAAALFESERERRSLIVRHYALRSAKIKRARRIVYLSDFHERRLGDIEERLHLETKRLKPDYIFLGGDMVTAKHGASIEAKAITRRDWTAIAGATEISSMNYRRDWNRRGCAI